MIASLGFLVLHQFSTLSVRADTAGRALKLVPLIVKAAAAEIPQSGWVVGSPDTVLVYAESFAVQMNMLAGSNLRVGDITGALAGPYRASTPDRAVRCSPADHAISCQTEAQRPYVELNYVMQADDGFDVVFTVRWTQRRAPMISSIGVHVVRLRFQWQGETWVEKARQLLLQS